jgi:two-component system sensor histidine kinase HydH
VDLQSQTALLAAIVTLALAISFLLRPRKRALTLFSVLSLSLFAFYVFEFLEALAPSPLWARASLFFGSLVPTAALAFFREFLGGTSRGARRSSIAAGLGGLAGLVVAVSPLARSKAAVMLVAVLVFGGLLVSFSLLLRRMAQTESRIERARLRYLAIGAGLAIGAAAVDQLPHGDLPFPPVGAVTAALYMFLLAQTLQRLRLLDLHEVLGKVAALSLQALLLVAMFVLLVYWTSPNFGLFVFNSLVGSIVVLILIDPLRSKVDEFVVATLFRERFEMLRTLDGLRARLASVIDVREMARLVLDTVHETRRVTHASIYLLSDERPGFFLLDSRGPAPVAFFEAAAARGLISVAMAGQKAVLLENLERRLAELRAGAEQHESRRSRDETKRLNDLRNALRQMNAGITVPMFGGDRVIGFLNLWDERVPEAYASDEIAQILEVAERVANIVENSKLYERLKERDRLAALGEMAAGLAHEIRNPLGAIKGAAQFLSPQGLAAEDAELLGVIVEEVDRLNTVVTQFLDYSRPLKPNLAPTDPGDVLVRTVKLLSKTIPAAVEVRLDVGEKLPRVQADAEQLKQVLINLVQNAVQAMPGGGTITLSARGSDDVPAWRLAGGTDFLELRVRDTGKGIAEEGRQHIFVPFYTTKEKGTGLGLAICQRIVKSHGGSITLHSKLGEGTEFVIRLPAIPEPRPERPAEGSPSPEGTQSPELTPYPGSLAPPGLRPEPARRDRRRRRTGGG